MLTAKGKYGLKALVHLASLPWGDTAQCVDIAEANNIPKKFLDAILGDLRNAGVVRSRKGPGGGYMLARPANDIKVGFVIRTLDGPLAPIACASRTAYRPCEDCDDVKACTVRLAMAKVRDAMADILDRMTVADLSNLRGRRGGPVQSTPEHLWGNLRRLRSMRRSSAARRRRIPRQAGRHPQACARDYVSVRSIFRIPTERRKEDVVVGRGRNKRRAQWWGADASEQLVGDKLRPISPL
jgi:Rrf2 family protein